ncbi:MAG TPA: DUF420 domain-containing protein [Candidatus Acidoferrales bacterium]|nr:DUF420 domain-containing protein [Candidatus Acidoferrales bacterium]
MFSHATLNACLNASSALFLFAGYLAVLRRRINVHRACMVSALVCSAAFLVSYVIYHLQVGSVRFQGQGLIRPIYFTLLLSHTILAVVIVPLVIITVRRALRSQFELHRRIARWTLPLWFYVSITGVLIYFLLYHLYATPLP